MSRKWKTILISLGFFWSLGTITFAEEAQKTQPILFHPTGAVTYQETRPQTNGFEPPGYVADQILVKFKDDIPDSTVALAHVEVQAAPLRKFRVVKNLHLVRLPRGLSMQKALASYRRNPHVLYAEPNYIVKVFATPNDPLFSSLWGLHNTGQNGGTPGADIQALDAWDITTGSKDVVVAVIDTGVDYNHEDLAANMWRNTADCNNNWIDDDGNGYIDDCYGIDAFNNDSDPMDDHDHGTHVAGIIGAVGNNNVGVVGVNWNVSIMACKFLDLGGHGYTSGAIECFEYVKDMKDKGVNIVATNNSWGSSPYFSQALFDAVEAHKQSGILFIAAAGNEQEDNDVTPTFPASYDLSNIISVAATDISDGLAGYSNYGRRSVHLGAPGNLILSTVINGYYVPYSGTSMAAPYVTGVAALLKAQDPRRDYLAIRNLILAGGDLPPSVIPTVSRKRLNAFGALTCSNSIVLSRLLPTFDLLDGAVGRAIDLASLHINCEEPNGDVQVVVSPGGDVITLKDDGLGIDKLMGDGIYSGQWAPPSPGTFTLTYPDNDVLTVWVDPDLDLGFPVKALHSKGDVYVVPNIVTLVGNIDNDPRLEIVVTGLCNGPLYAWHADGAPVGGWPQNTFITAYPTMGNLSNGSPGFEVVSAYATSVIMTAYSGSGQMLNGWPVTTNLPATSPAGLADIDGDGLDEIFISLPFELHAYRSTGSPLPGWPINTPYIVDTTPAIADLDGDGDFEIIYTVSNSPSYQYYLLAFHADGKPVMGFPAPADIWFFKSPPVVGDVDGDGTPEIIAVGTWVNDTRLLIFSRGGQIKRTIMLPSLSLAVPALADLDGDSIPEIIVQTTTALHAIRADGSPFPGWPVTFEDEGCGTSSPVVGDIDGDQIPDIVIIILPRGSTERVGEVRVYSRHGVLHPHFPKILNIGYGAEPAIADIDLDGRNEIIISGGFWRGGYHDKVWVYDLGGPPHGAIQWGQFMGGPKHQGYYGPSEPSNKRFDLSIMMTDSPDPVIAGQNLTYTITVNNNGPETAIGVQVFDTLPSGFALNSLTTSQGSCAGTNTVVCDLGTITSSGSATIVIEGVQSAGGYINNSATVTGYGIDFNTINNTITIVTTVTETNPPLPNPMTWQWSSPIHGNDSTSISMVATTAYDSQTPPVYYYFEFVDSPTGGTGGANSTWQISTNYIDTGLQPNHKYGYRVKARDSAVPTPNETSFSSITYGYTRANTPKDGLLSTVAPSCIRASWTSNGNRNGTEYYCENTTTGSSSWWIPNLYWDSCGLTFNDTYEFRVKARNGDKIETGWLPLGSQQSLFGILVISPNGTETYEAGSIQTIRWSYGGNPGSSAKIELLKGGVLTTTISYFSSIGSGGSGSYNWSVPSTQVAGSDYQIKVTSTNNSSYTDTSNGNFTIVGPPPPEVIVTFPNGGESLTAGSTQSIRWNFSGNPGSFAKIELLKAGVPISTISGFASMGSGGSGSYNWSIPSTQTAGSDYQIRVTSMSNASCMDMSDGNFTIVGPPPPTISVTSPNGGETLTAGSTQTIRWSYGGNPGSFVKIELFKTGVSVSTISGFASMGSGGSGSHNWAIPSNQTLGNDYTVRITSATNSSYTDTSDGNFTIVGPPPPTISVTSPNGGETLTGGSTQTIRWNYSGNPGSFAKIELLKAGVPVSTISGFASMGSGGSGSYNWSIPSTQTSGSDYQIKVTSMSNASCTDMSDTFTIVGPPPPEIIVTFPNGGETLTAGSTQPIRWNYSGNPGSFVKIELLKGGVVTTTISYFTLIGSAGNGSYNWSIPSTQTVGSDYQIKVTSMSNNSYSDTSDSSFTIGE